MCRTTFEDSWGKLQNLLRVKLTSNVTLLFLSAVDNDIFVYFLYCKYALWNSLNQQIFVILVIDFPVQLKWISAKSSWETMVYCKFLWGEWTAVREQKMYYLTNLVFSEGGTDSCYFVPILENPWTYVKQGWRYEVWQSTMTWYMNFFALSYSLRYDKRLVA